MRYLPLLGVASRLQIPQKKLRKRCTTAGIPLREQVASTGSISWEILESDVPRLEESVRDSQSTLARSQFLSRRKKGWSAPPSARACGSCGRPADPLSGRCGCS